RRIASKEGAAVAEVHAQMARARTEGLLEPDQAHLTFAGYRVMARAVLDAMGRTDLVVPEALTIEPMAGLVREWKIRPLPDGAAWELTLPQPGPSAHWWFDQERRRGFAVELDKAVGGGKRFQATATIEST